MVKRATERSGRRRWTRRDGRFVPRGGRSNAAAAVGRTLRIPDERDDVTLDVDGRALSLTNLSKPFWPEIRIAKRDLIQYYADVAPVLLPHLTGRAMVMKRYPNGWRGKHFFMKRTPEHAPDWLSTCAIEHASGSVIDFPVVDGLASLLWLVNLGCIDMNPWYSRCGDIDRPDYLHFDLDPVPPAGFDAVRECALRLKDMLDRLGMPSYAKTTGSKGIHVYIPIVRGPVQKDVWRFAKSTALVMAEQHPELVTAEYRIAKRPPGRVLVDYNQNAWGRTLASAYSVRPTPRAAVSAPVRWSEVEAGVAIDDFRIDTMPARVRDRGDLWRPLVWPTKGRFELRSALE